MYAIINLSKMGERNIPLIELKNTISKLNDLILTKTKSMKPLQKCDCQ